MVLTATCVVFLFRHAVRGREPKLTSNPARTIPLGTGTVPDPGIRHNPGESYDWDSAQSEYNDSSNLAYTGQDGSIYVKTWEPEAKTGYQVIESDGSS